MDKNQAIGLLLSGLLLILYFQFFAPEPIPATEPQANESTDSAALNRSNTPVSPQISNSQRDSLQRIADEQKYGLFAPAAQGTEKRITIENEDAVISFNTLGGKVEQVTLKDYQTYEGNPLVLIDADNNAVELLAGTRNGTVNLKELYYTSSSQNGSVSPGDTLTITFTASLSGGHTLQQTYTVPGEGYEIGYELQVSNPQQVFTSDELTLVWNEALKDLEKDIEESRRRSAMIYYTGDGDLDKFDVQGEGEKETEEVAENLSWISMKQRFFSSAVVAEQPFKSARLAISNPEASSRVVKTMGMEVKVPFENGRAGFSYYYGPNDLQTMRRVATDFEENIDFGWPVVRWISKFVIAPLFHFLEGFISNYGIIIIVLVLVIKTVLFPLSYKSYISMAKIKVLKPELDEIKEKYGDDMQKAQSEQMQLYQKVGVNPLSGCVPVLLQMPILLAMFNFFPNSIELRQEPFLWTDDLSTYDSILDLPFTIPFYGDHVSLFVLLMTASTILYTWSNNQASTVQGPMKSMQYFLPIIFMFVLNSFPAALSFYYFVSNIVTFGQQAIIRKFVDDDKIRNILEENKKRNRNKKKSKFQLRLEDAMKASEEVRKKSNNKGSK